MKTCNIGRSPETCITIEYLKITCLQCPQYLMGLGVQSSEDRGDVLDKKVNGASLYRDKPKGVESVA